MAELAIETKGLTRRFGETVAVDRIDLSVSRGTLYGFLGPNGAGKSTTIKMLTGLLRISDGAARVLGRDLAQDEVEIKRRIGVVPEELALYDRLTGSEYLTFVGRMYGLDRPTIRARGDELLELMGLGDEPKKLIVDYSHGMQKKLALAAALIHGPELLFLDEPFEGMDAISARLVKSLLGRLLARGATVFLTSHILEIVEKLCTEVAIIHRGRLVAQGALDDLRRGISLPGDPPGERMRSLEEAFLSLVDAPASDDRTLSWLG